MNHGHKRNNHANHSRNRGSPREERERIKENSSPTGHISRWISDMLHNTGEEENLAKVYETGFHMMMLEKGILDDE